MKKLMAIIFSIVIAISGIMLNATTAATAASNTTLLGDADRDGNLDSTDAMYMMYYIALVGAGYPKDDVYSHFDIEIDERIFDVDRNEVVDTTDVLYLLTYVGMCGAGQDATWPPVPEKIYCDDILVFNPVKGVKTWNLRSAPSLEASVVTKISAGETCKVIKIMPKSWYEVEYFGIDLYLQITPDSESCFFVDPIPQETTSTTTEQTTTTTAETTSTTTEQTTTTTVEATSTTTEQTTKTTVEATSTTTEQTTTTTAEATSTTTKQTTTATTETTSTTTKQTTTTTAETTSMAIETTTANTITENETKPTTTETTEETTNTSTTASTLITTTTTEELKIGDVVTPSENITLVSLNDTITVNAGETVTIISKNENGNYVVLYQKKLYELNTPAYLNKVKHEYQEKQLSTVEEIETGDILKFTGDTWYIRDESESAVGTLKKNELFAVMAKSGNTLTIITSDGTIGNIFCIADKYCMMVD